MARDLGRRVGGQHAFMGTTISNQTWAPDGYLLRAAGGSLGRVIGCFFIPSAKGRATSPIRLVSKAGPWTVSQSQFMGFIAPLVSMDGSVPKSNFSDQGNMVIPWTK